MGRKINISLVGKQCMPVYVYIEYAKPDYVVLVHSRETKEEATQIKEECGLPASLFEMQPVDYPNILNYAEALLNQFTYDEVTINITGGTKLWSLAFAMLANGKEHVSVVYVDQNNMIYDLKNNTKSPSQLSLSTKRIFLYNGQRNYRYTLLSDYTADDMNVLQKIASIPLSYYNDFTRLTVAKDKRWKNTLENATNPCLTLATGSSIDYDKANKKVEMVLYNKKSIPYSLTISSSHVRDIVFNAGWFEYQVATRLAKWKSTKEIWLNVKFNYAQNSSVKNEVDIVVNVGDKLLFVECKTQIFDNTDIDKFSAAVKNYGGMSSKALFIVRDKIRDITQQKCGDHGIMTFCLLGKNNKPRPDQELFDLLDSQILNINKR